MPDYSSFLGLALVAFGMVLTPGPNMIYLVSRSICQGPMAGLISLTGVFLGFVFYMLMAAFGITAVIMAVPFAYDALRLAGAAYLAYLAWQAFKPGGRSAFEVRNLPKDSPRKLFTMGLMTNLLNPKAAVMYLSLIPQFIDIERGNVFLQSILLGMTQITISMIVNALIAISAGAIALFMTRKPIYAVIQRWLMGTVLGFLAVRMAFEARR